MKRPELYKKTCDILYDAYFNDTLIHGTCFACAVSNIIASNLGKKIWRPFKDLQNEDMFYPIWDEVFYTVKKRYQNINFDLYKGDVKCQIDASGYSVEDLAKIEYAFETAKYGGSDENYMFNGLCAVIEVLNKIHEVEEDTQTVRFEKHYQSKILQPQ